MSDPDAGTTAHTTAADSSSLAELVRRIRSRFAGDGVGSRVATGAFRSLIVNVVGMGISFVGQVIMARALGIEGFGVYVVSLAAMNAVLVLGKLELDSATTRFLGGYVGARLWSLAHGFAQWSARTVLTSSLVVALLGWAAVEAGRGSLTARHPAYPAALTAACALLVMNAQLMLRGAQLQAFKRFVASQFPGTVLRPLLLALVIGTMYYGFRRQPSPAIAVLVNFAATSITVLVVTALARAARPASMNEAPPEFARVKWLRASYGLIAIGAAQLILSQTSDVLIVGAVVSTQDSALYSAATQFALLVAFGQTSVSFVAAPMIADLHERGERAELQRLVWAVGKANALVTVPLMLGLIVLGPWLLSLYGAPFRAAYPVLVLLVLAASTVAMVGSVSGFLLTMTEYQVEAAWIIGGSAILNLALTLIFTPLFGLMGTATATLVATVARTLVLVTFIKRRMDISVLALRLSPQRQRR